jgi:hypothetical protein
MGLLVAAQGFQWSYGGGELGSVALRWPLLLKAYLPGFGGGKSLAAAVSLLRRGHSSFPLFSLLLF